MRGIEIPDEFPGHISCGEFGKGIITLDLDSIYCRLPTLTSMILSLPDLKKLRIKHYGAIPEGPLPTCPVTPGVTHQNGHLHSDTQGLARSAGKTQRTGGDDRGKGQ